MSNQQEEALDVGDELIAERRGGPEAPLPDDMNPITTTAQMNNEM